MADPKSRGSTPPADDGLPIVDADPDPETVAIAHKQQTADEDASFAKAEAGFAAVEHKHADQLREEGRWQEAEYYDHDARDRMTDAQRVMQQAVGEEAEADRLREDKKQHLAQALQRMPNQSIATLRTAVGEVRHYVQDMSAADKLKVGLATGLDADQIDRLREDVVATGFAIEQRLASEDGARANSRQVILDLVRFTAAVMTLADHLPALMDLVHRFGQLLLQFHL